MAVGEKFGRLCYVRPTLYGCNVGVAIIVISGGVFDTGHTLPAGLSYTITAALAPAVSQKSDVLARLFQFESLSGCVMNKDSSVELPICPQCAKPVELETAWVDESGKAVHADCYLGKLRREQASAPPLEK